MTAVLDPPEQVAAPITLHGVPWSLYEQLLETRARAGQRVRLTYDRGMLEIMTLSSFHEKWKKIIARMIEAMGRELNIPVSTFGSTTFKRAVQAKGLEPDECYYVQNAAVMASRFDIDFENDPPPDLAVEVDYTHHDVNREELYASLGVPELWRFDGKRLHGLLLGEGGKYEESESSRAFPFLKFADIARFMALALTQGDDAAVRAFVEWVVQTHKSQ